MGIVKRYDYQSTVAAKTEMTPEGFLKVMARATRTGVLSYKQMDGTIIRELRHPDEVFKPESMASLALKPMTNRHPSQLLDSENAAMYQVGMTGETVKIDGKYLEVMCVITDKAAIADAESGRAVEVSPGYVCELDFTPGVYDGEEYDAIQKNIRYNHLAQVKKGRSGPEVRLRLDADDAVLVDLNKKKELPSMKMKLNDKDWEMDEDLGNAIKEHLKNKERPAKEEMDKAKKDAADSETARVEAAKTVEQLQAKADGLADEIAKLKKERTDSAPADIRAAVKARMAIENVAKIVGVEKFDELEDLDLKKAVIKADSPEAVLDGKSEEYINARFDVASESISASESSAKKLGEKIVDKQVTENMDSESARQKMIDRQKSQWKGKE